MNNNTSEKVYRVLEVFLCPFLFKRKPQNVPNNESIIEKVYIVVFVSHIDTVVQQCHVFY